MLDGDPMTNEIPDGPWALGQGERDGKPMFLRANTGAARLAGDPRYGQRISVAVPIRSPKGDGFPQPDEAFEIDAIEDRLVDALAAAGPSIFVLVITTGGTRQFVFYTADAAASAAALEELSRTIEGHELQHVVEPDPEWDVFEQFADFIDLG
jgi:hypothetical protein